MPWGYDSPGLDYLKELKSSKVIPFGQDRTGRSFKYKEQ